ncbi:MAG: PfkB family carbohydrate kinase, partial [Candidatus Limnocylindrales bacterium]
GGSALIRLLGRARQRGATTSLDLSVVARGTRLDGYDWPAFLRGTLPYVDVLSPSADDLGSMLGTAAVGSIDQLRALASSLVGWGAGVVMITAGHDGLVVESARQARLERGGAVLAGLAASWADASLWVPAPKVAVTSTTGAGDAASAAIIHALLRAQDPLTAAHTTVAIASARVGGKPVSGAARPADHRA